MLRRRDRGPGPARGYLPGLGGVGASRRVCSAPGEPALPLQHRGRQWDQTVVGYIAHRCGWRAMKGVGHERPPAGVLCAMGVGGCGGGFGVSYL